MTMTLIEQLNAVIIAIAKDISNNSGNSSGNSGNSGDSSSDNSALLPRKIGGKWYKSGLRYGADYPYPYTKTEGYGSNGAQYFVPFTALEDATITGLEIYCTISKETSTVRLGIYASDDYNDVADPLFTSDPISCSTIGVKNAPCNVQIEKGKVYWLSSLSIILTSGIGMPVFHRNGADSLFPIKGTTTALQATAVGYYTESRTSMAQSVPTNKIEISTYAPRVMFITG